MQCRLNKQFHVTKIIDVQDHCQDLSRLSACVTGEGQQYIAFRDKTDAIRYADSITFHTQMDGIPNKPGESLVIYAPVLKVELQNTSQLTAINLIAKEFLTGQETELKAFSTARDEIKSISAISFKAGPANIQIQNASMNFHLNEIDFPEVKTQEFLTGSIRRNRSSCAIL